MELLICSIEVFGHIGKGYNITQSLRKILINLDLEQLNTLQMLLPLCSNSDKIKIGGVISADFLQSLNQNASFHTTIRYRGQK